MFGIGLPELLLILALALIVLGPEKMPRVAGQLARMIAEIKKSASEFRGQLDLEDVTENAKERPWWETQTGKDAVAPPDKEAPVQGRPDLGQRDRPPGGLGTEWHEAGRRGKAGSHADARLAHGPEEAQEVPKADTVGVEAGTPERPSGEGRGTASRSKAGP